MMDKIIKLCVLLVMSAVVACNGKDEDDLSVSEKQISLSGDGQSYVVQVKTDARWTAVSDAAWCSVESLDNLLTLSVEANLDGVGRTAKIKISAGSSQATVTVTQEVLLGDVNLSTNSLLFTGNAESKTLTVKANTAWTVSMPENDWCVVSPESGTTDAIMTVTVTKNISVDSRSVVVSVGYIDALSGEPEHRQLTVKQSGAELSIVLSATELTLPQTASSTTIDVEATASWKASVTTGAEWLSLSESGGVAGRSKLTLSAVANTLHTTRTATVQFESMNKVPASLTLVQDSLPHTFDTVRFMSYNQHYGYGMDNVIDYSRVSGIINRYKPRFVAVQELDSVTTRSKKVYQLSELAARTGMYGTYCPTISYQGGKYGIGILSVDKPISVRSVALPVSGEARRVVIAEFEHYVFCCTHFPLNVTERYNAVDVVVAEVKRYTTKPVILGGDFNALPSEASISRMNTYFKMISNPTIYTFPADAPDRTIDYLYLYRATQVPYKVIGSGVIAESVASDHRPIWADVVFTLD